MPFSLGFTKAKSYGTMNPGPGRIIWSMPTRSSVIVIKEDQDQRNAAKHAGRIRERQAKLDHWHQKVKPVVRKIQYFAMVMIGIGWILAGIIIFKGWYPSLSTPHRSCAFQEELGITCLGNAYQGIDMLKCGDQMLQRIPDVGENMGRSAWIDPLKETVFGCQAVDGPEVLFNDSIWKCQEAEYGSRGTIHAVCAKGDEE